MTSPSQNGRTLPWAIAEKPIGEGHPCYIIAEAGSNHDRDLQTALALVDAAAEAGCDAVKFQTFTGDDIAARWESPATLLPKEFARWGKTLHDLYCACAMPDEFHEPLARRAHDRQIQFLSTPFSEKAVDRLIKLGVPALKIASFELVHLPLIRYAAKTGVPLILSTGMASLGDIERALEAALSGGARHVALMHCGSSYPLEPKDVHLAAIETLRRAFGVPVGYSDHTLGITIPIAAAARGANLLEKHFTLSRSGQGPDHAFALEPAELSAMVRSMRAAEAAIGQTMKRRQGVEQSHAVRGRRSLFAAQDLSPGDVLTRAMIKIVRPGTGLEPSVLDTVLGRRLRRPVKAESPLTWDDFFEDRS